MLDKYEESNDEGAKPIMNDFITEEGKIVVMMKAYLNETV